MTNSIAKTATLVALLSTATLAQTNTPYSSIGLGVVEFSQSPRDMGMADYGVAHFRALGVATMNPALWSSISSTRMDVGMLLDGSFDSHDGTSRYDAGAIFTGLLFGVPLSDEYGVSLAAGLVPYTVSNFENEFSGAQLGSPVSATITSKGEGGLSKAFVGASARLPLDFSIGASYNYYAGNLSREQSIDFDDAALYDVEYRTANRLFGSGVTLGIVSPDLAKPLGLESISGLRIGASVETPGTLDQEYFHSYESGLLDDTTGFLEGELTAPTRTVVGIAATVNNWWRVHVDYLQQPWSELKGLGDIERGAQDQWRLSAGLEYRNLELADPGWEPTTYRCGISFERTPFEAKATSISQYGVGAGISFPVSPGNTVDFALQYFHRGESGNGLVVEDVVRLGVGLSFGEIWFIRPER
jgi:opacity protein-like surface antigen